MVLTKGYIIIYDFSISIALLKLNNNSEDIFFKELIKTDIASVKATVCEAIINNQNSNDILFILDNPNQIPEISNYSI